MLYYSRTDVSEGIDVNKKSASKIICLYCYFLGKGFTFQSSSVCSGCHDVLMMSVDLDSITILKIHGIEYCCIITRISKIEALNL